MDPSGPTKAKARPIREKNLFGPKSPFRGLMRFQSPRAPFDIQIWHLHFHVDRSFVDGRTSSHVRDVSTQITVNVYVVIGSNAHR